MKHEKLYQVDDIKYEIDNDDQTMKVMTWGKASSTGWTDIQLLQKAKDNVQEEIKFDLVGIPPQNHEGIHDPTLPVLTDVFVEAVSDISELTEPIFSITVSATHNEKTLNLNED